MKKKKTAQAASEVKTQHRLQGAAAQLGEKLARRKEWGK